MIQDCAYLYTMSNAQHTPMTFSAATIADVKDAFASAREFKICGSDWTKLVDPETMDEVRAVYREESENDGSLSLYNVFCKALKA